MNDYNADVKDSLFIRLWNRETFREYESLLPHRYFGDLVISCLIDLKKLTGMPGAAHVSWHLLKDYGITEDQLFEDASTSAPMVKPVRMERVSEAIKRITGTPGMDTALRVITTEDGMYGASAIMYPGVLEAAAQGRNLFLIPSSIHEFLCLEDDGSQLPIWIEEIIRCVNSEEVAPEEVLSDHLYYYNAQEKKTSIIRTRNRVAV